MSDADSRTARSDSAPETAARSPDVAALTPDDRDGGSLAVATVTIARPRDELFAFFRDFANLPRFMENVARIDVASPDRSHWVVDAPGGGTVEWDATVVEEEPGSLLAWTAAEDADVPNSGRVTFADAGARGTVVSATIVYDPPAGAIGKLVAKLTQKEPAIQARRDLRRFKMLMETGEIATSAWTREQDQGPRAPAS